MFAVLTMEPLPLTPGVAGTPANAEGAAFVERTCVPFLRENQNEDGGWSFHAGHESRVEPTAWALLALGSDLNGLDQDVQERGLRFLAGLQLENGGWPAASGDREGCWVTSLACWALQSRKEYMENVGLGLRWLTEDRPGDSSVWWRTARKLTVSKKVNAQNPSLSGWSWTPHTASWVEPTSFAMIVLSRTGMAPASPLRRRYTVAEAMLYDRMCPGGGWNCGNPRIYGVPGQPQIGPTVWALVALRENSQRLENQQSLAWLAGNWDRNGSQESFGLAHIALQLYGRSDPRLAENLRASTGREVGPWSVPAAAWTILAFREGSRWLNAELAAQSER
jgi:hypothetical protein